MKALRALLGIALIVAVIVAVFNLVPPFFHNYELQDDITEEARLNTYTSKSAEEMKDSIFRKCKEYDLPVTRDQVNVRRDAQGVAIWIDYTVHVDLPVYPVDLQFHPSTKNKSF